MLKRLAAAALMGTALTGLAHAAGGAADGSIREVTLSSGGLAEVVRGARVNGSGSIVIEVPLDQVDDVLKSLVVRDTSGSVTGMSLGGASQVDETFKKMPFSPADMGDVWRLVGAMQGTEVKATSGGRSVQGKTLGVAASKGPDGQDVRTLSVLTSDGAVQSLVLGSDASVYIEDESMRRKVAEAAAAIGKGKVDGARTVEIKVTGQGDRDVGISYVVPASVWKTAYRIVNAGKGGKARLQAWAIIENSTGEDWKNVNVTLSSGAPVTLKQRLHQRYWQQRPEVPVETSSGQVPPVDRGAGPRGQDGSKRMMSMERAMPAPASEPMMMKSLGGGAAAVAADMVMAAPSDAVTATEGDVSASYPLPRTVDLPSGDTLSVPIVDAEVKAERVSVYRSREGGNNPVSALRITNETGASLPPGIVTVYDEKEGYVGDARLPAMAKGTERMASFATDRKMEITSSERPEEEIVQVTVADGLLRATRRTRAVVTYTVKGAPDAARKVIIEHPKREGWTFKASVPEESDVPGAHRISAAVRAGETVKVDAVHEITNQESVRIADVDADMLLHWTNGVSDPKMADRLRKLADARAQLASAESEIRELDGHVQRIATDQGRIRENLKAVPPQSELAAGYVSQMRDQEQELSGLAKRRKELEDTVRRQRNAVGGIIKTL